MQRRTHYQCKLENIRIFEAFLYFYHIFLRWPWEVSKWPWFWVKVAVKTPRYLATLPPACILCACAAHVGLQQHGQLLDDAIELPRSHWLVL